MRYINAIKGSIIAFIIFSMAAFLMPGKGPSNEVEIVLTISTFLFAILAGFFISRLNSRYDRIREHIATEDACWISFYNICRVYGDGFAKKIGNIMDKYYITSFDYDLPLYYKPTIKYMTEIHNEIIKIKKYRHEGSYSRLLSSLASIEENRNKASVSGLEKLTKGQWAVMICLACIIVYSVFYIKTQLIHSNIMVIILCSVLVLVLLMMRDLQNFRLAGELPVEESGQEVLEQIGKLRYYNQIYLKSGANKVSKEVKKYRLGLHKPGEKPNIKIITR